MDRPKISVLTPSYNSGKHIDRAIQSVLKQNYKNWEHIIVDGKSTDNTSEILNKYTHLTWVSEPDRGQSDAMNKAFRMSTGDIIVYLNADDCFEENIFGKVCTKFARNIEMDMLLGNIIIDFEGRKRELRKPSVAYQDILMYWKNLFPANPVSYFYRRELQLSVGEFPLNYHYTMDYWFLLRAYRLGQVRYLDKVFGTFYLDGYNKTAKSWIVRNLHVTMLKHLIGRWHYRIFLVYFAYLKYYGFRRTVEFKLLSWYIQRILEKLGYKAG